MKKFLKEIYRPLSTFSKQLENMEIHRLVSFSHLHLRFIKKRNHQKNWLPNPATLFGVAKKTAEDLIRLSGFEHAIIRIANIYGPGCRPEYNSVIATFCHKSVNGEPLRIDGDGHQERDFIYVEDVINAMVLAGIKVNNFISGVYNIGTNRTASLRHIIQSINSSGLETKESYSPNASIGQNSFSLDSTYFRQQFKWVPETTLQSGIKKTLHSFQKEVT